MPKEYVRIAINSIGVTMVTVLLLHATKVVSVVFNEPDFDWIFVRKQQNLHSQVQFISSSR